MLHELCEHPFARIHDEIHGRKIPVSQNIHVQVGDTPKHTIFHSASICYSPFLQNCRTLLVSYILIWCVHLVRILEPKMVFLFLQSID